MADRPSVGRSTAADASDAPAERPYRPMAVGFVLLALPLFAATFLADDADGRAANVASGVVMVALGLLLDRRKAR